MEIIGETLDATFGGRWAPFLVAVGAYIVYVLKLYEQTPQVKGNPAAKDLLDRIRMIGGITVTTFAVLLAGQAIFGSLEQGALGLGITVAVAIAVGCALLWVGRKDGGSTPGAGEEAQQPEPSKL